MKIGIIGNKNQSQKLQKILIKKNVKIEKIFHPIKKFEDKKFTNDLEELYKSDAIIIASPNHTHFKYVKILIENFSGYIFCEKPPVINKKELIEIEKISRKNKKRLFFNFNLRFSNINNQIQKQINSKYLGKIVHVNIISSKGLAFKEEYLKSWRSNGKQNLHNILDAITIHFIDLLIFNFGEIKKFSYHPGKNSNKGTAFDTANIILEFKNGLKASIFNSYTTPLHDELTVFGTNGILKIDNKKLRIFSPRDTFDVKGFFKTPPIKLVQNISFQREFYTSTENSVEYFLKHVKKKNPINTKLFDLSMASNRIVLEMKTQN